jgi:hypothetical protein
VRLKKEVERLVETGNDVAKVILYILLEQYLAKLVSFRFLRRF